MTVHWTTVARPVVMTEMTTATDELVVEEEKLALMIAFGTKVSQVQMPQY